MSHWVFTIFVFIMFSVGFSPVTAAEHARPFSPGEKLVFELRWEAIPAGQAVLEVLEPETINGERSNHFVLTAKSNRFVDIFYKVRDRIDSFTDIAMTRSLLYTKKQKEGGHQKNVTVSFDWKNQTAQYSNKGKAKDPIPIKQGTFDPLAALYYVRLTADGNQMQIERPISDGKKNVIGMIKVIRRERIKCPLGTFDTFLIEPDLRHVGGVFRKSKNAKIQVWITADEKRIPVRIKSRVVIGRFIGELVDAQGL